MTVFIMPEEEVAIVFRNYFDVPVFVNQSRSPRVQVLTQHACVAGAHLAVLGGMIYSSRRQSYLLLGLAIPRGIRGGRGSRDER